MVWSKNFVANTFKTVKNEEKRKKIEEFKLKGFYKA